MDVSAAIEALSHKGQELVPDVLGHCGAELGAGGQQRARNRRVPCQWRWWMKKVGVELRVGARGSDGGRCG